MTRRREFASEIGGFLGPQYVAKMAKFERDATTGRMQLFEMDRGELFLVDERRQHKAEARCEIPSPASVGGLEYSGSAGGCSGGDLLGFGAPGCKAGVPQKGYFSWRKSNGGVGRSSGR